MNKHASKLIILPKCPAACQTEKLINSTDSIIKYTKSSSTYVYTIYIKYIYINIFNFFI